MHGHELKQDRRQELCGQVGAKINVREFVEVISLLERLNICAGHHFLKMAEARKGNFMSASGDLVAFVDRNAVVQLDGNNYAETIRVSECQLLIGTSKKCQNCVAYRSILRSMYHRWLKQQSKSPSSQVVSSTSHANDRWMCTPQRKEKVSKLKSRMRLCEKKVKYIKAKIGESVTKKGINADDSLHEGLHMIMDDMIKKKYSENSFHRLFWSQQVQNVSRDSRHRRWHPMLIRWCLNLKMLSSSAYDSLRRILTLPCGRTLQDYTHFIKAGVGIQADVTRQLMSEVKIETLEDWQKYVTVVFDEMKIREGLVYDKHGCTIVGFVDVGTVNNALLSFERSLNDSKSDAAPVAKHMLVFLVRGLFIKLCFPYAQYPTCTATADALFFLVWEVIRHLECAGLKVIAITCDGASSNRRLFVLHRKACGLKKSDVVHKVRNPYSIEERYIFFSRTCHRPQETVGPTHLVTIIRELYG